MSNPLEPPSKHPRDMTTTEAVQHLFHPDVPAIVQRLKDQKDEPKKPRLKKE